LYIIIIIAIVVFVAYQFTTQDKPKFEARKKENNVIYMPYKKKYYFLSKAENNFYKVLKTALKDTEHYISIKAKLTDFIIVKKHPDRLKYFNKIRAKHVDFLICNNDKYFNPILAIELDDKSHNDYKRIKRDNFVDDVYRSIDLPIIHIKASNSYNINDIKQKIDEKLENHKNTSETNNMKGETHE